MRRAIVTIILLLAAVGAQRNLDAQASTPLTPSGGEIPRNQTGTAKSSPHGAPCLFDFERGEVPNCVVKNATGESFIARQYLKELTFDSYGLAAVFSTTGGWMYVNRIGRVIISGVPVMDNWADEFHDALVRFVRDKKYGFANRTGQIVIPPTYDGAMNFEKGNAEVCNGCQNKCVGVDCEDHMFSGGDWFLINTKGAVLKRIHPDN